MVGVLLILKLSLNTLLYHINFVIDLITRTGNLLEVDRSMLWLVAVPVQLENNNACSVGSQRHYATGLA